MIYDMKLDNSDLTTDNWQLWKASCFIMTSLFAVALPLAMAIASAIFVLVSPVAGQLSTVGLPQSPPCRAPGSTQSAALQDAVEGIAGLMQRFEDLQPQIGQLPPGELQQIAQPAQKLHERFENMQKKLVAINGNAGPELEEASKSCFFLSSFFLMASVFGCCRNMGMPLKHTYDYNCPIVSRGLSNGSFLTVTWRKPSPFIEILQSLWMGWHEGTRIFVAYYNDNPVRLLELWIRMIGILLFIVAVKHEQVEVEENGVFARDKWVSFCTSNYPVKLQSQCGLGQGQEKWWSIDPCSILILLLYQYHVPNWPAHHHTVPQKPMGILIEAISSYISEAESFLTKQGMER